jgi:hypothetical protein
MSVGVLVRCGKALDRLVFQKKGNTLPNGSGRLGFLNRRTARELVFDLPLDRLCLSPRAGTRGAAVLGAVVAPAEVLLALTAAAEFVTLVLAVCRMSNENRNDWRVHVLSELGAHF